MENRSPWKNKIFELTREGSDALRKFESGESVPLGSIEIQVLNMIKEDYLPYYEISDSLLSEYQNMDEQSAFNIVKYLEVGGYIRNG
jgi:hypothetical protein